MLDQIGESWRVGGVRYRSCLSVLLGYEHEFQAPYHALIDPEQRNPVIWISVESLKSPKRAPTGHSAFVAQMGARFSAEHFQDSDYEIAREAKIMMVRLFGDKFANPATTHVRRWQNSQPEIATSFETANRNATTLILAGDALAGPRVELAYEVGVRAADYLLERNS
jgi:predicted NAD/FAD-dependent oxidoreductase